jgi:hypothetical protein
MHDRIYGRCAHCDSADVVTAVTKSALGKALSDFKADERSSVTAAGTLTKIVNDYCREGSFSEYVEKHRMDAGNYLPESQKRTTRWRASSAGKCPQQQSYETLFNIVAGSPSEVERAIPQWAEFVKPIIVPPMQPNLRRALYNGTFNHVRYHMMFDHLHELGRVRTISAEEMHINEELSVSGTIDRLVEFDFDGQVVRPIVDFKTMNDNYFKELVRALPAHERQVTSYFLLEFECDWGMLLYENKNSQAISIQDVPWSDIAIQTLKDEYKLMNTWVDQMLQGATHSERVNVPINTAWCKQCPYNTMCLVEHPEREAAIRESLPGDGVF